MRPVSTSRLVLDQTDSTNAHAAKLARRGEVPLWVMAHKQTSARGRQNRAWHMPAGNFAASWVGNPQRPLAEFAGLSFAAALALHQALSSLTGLDHRLSLKWPNDVLLDGAKLAGILLETVRIGSVDSLIIGIGVNLSEAPPLEALPDLALQPISLAQATGHVVEPTDLLDALVPAFDRYLYQFETDGFGPIRDAWLRLAKGLGQPITARLQSAVHHGIFEDIDATGALVLKTNTERLVLPAADVYF